MATELPPDQAEHTRRTRAAYHQLAPVWSSTTDDGPFNGHLERPALCRFPEALGQVVGVPWFVVFRLVLGE